MAHAISHTFFVRLAWSVLPALVVVHAQTAAAQGVELSAAGLRAAYQRLGEPLAHSAFGRPFVLDSVETARGLKGDIFAVVEHPIGDVNAALDSPAKWCELLVLHINNKRCRVASAPAGDVLALSVVSHYDQPLEKAFELALAWRAVSATPEYFDAELRSDSGPMGTSNYRIALEAIPVGEGRTFLHFTYAYEHSMLTRLMTQAYLATFGRGKVGFTVVGKRAGGEADYIGGTRGLVERNAVRYFLTVDAYVGGTRYPQAEQFEKRLALWFTGIEQYPRQLLEVDRATYLELKLGDARDARRPKAPA